MTPGATEVIRGTPERNRTSNLRIKSPLLCQLSYGGDDRVYLSPR